MHTPEETEWFTTPQSTDTGVKKSYRMQEDSGFHSITPSSVPSVHDTRFQQCPGCHSEFEISFNISSDGSTIRTPDTKKFVEKLCHGCFRGRQLTKNFSHSASSQSVSFESIHVLNQNDSKQTLCTPSSNDVGMDISLYTDDEMEIDQFPLEMDNFNIHETNENNVIVFGNDSNFMIHKSVTNSPNTVTATSAEVDLTKNIIKYSTDENVCTSPTKSKSVKGRFEFEVTRDLPPRRENKQFRVKGKQSKFRNKYFQPLPIITSFVGLENIDILYHLQQAQLSLIISKILEYVEDRDLISITKVSKTWREICKNDHAAYKRYRKTANRIVTCTDIHKENFNLQKKQKPLERAVRGQFLQITNLQTSPPKSKPEQMSPHRNSWRFLAINENGKTSNTNEKMILCPRCRSLAKDPRNGMPVKCFRIGCQYEFCSICKSEYQTGHTCILLSTPRSRKYTPVGSAASKRNLRRLIQRS